MAETNGHDLPVLGSTPAPASSTASADELDALLAGLFEPIAFDIAPGRSFEIRPLMLDKADALYAGMSGAALQRFMLARCVFINGRPLGDELAATLPVALANRLVPVVMNVNGMEQGKAADDGEPADPKG